MSLRHRRALALVLMSSAFISACGLKPEVRDQLAQGGAGVAAGGGEQVAVDTDGDGTADAFAPADSAGTDAGVTDSTTTDAGTTGGGTTTTGGGTTTTTNGGSGGGTTTTGGGSGGKAAAPAAPVKGKGNTTGIDFNKKVIKVVVHGPLTGAGVPQNSFKTGGPKYWMQSGPGGGPRTILGGFKVEVEAVDDKYNAQDALRACNGAASKAFLIIGGAGTDQIQACAQSQVLRRGNVPYLSSGVTEAGLGKLQNYFATSLTYRQQSPLVVRAAKENGFLNKKWAVVITGTPNFADARESIVAELTKAGVAGKSGKFSKDNDVYLTEKAPNNCETLAAQLRGGGYESIYFLGQPLFFGLCVKSYPEPVYTGPGPSFGITSVGNIACQGSRGSYRGFYLHPTPDTQTAQGKAQGAPKFTDDIEAGIWSGMQQLEQGFALHNGPLNRQSFIAGNAKGSIKGGVALPAIYNGGSRFGGTGAYLNKITCNGTASVIKTVATYKTR